MSEQRSIYHISSNSCEYGHNLWNSVEPRNGDHLRNFAKQRLKLKLCYRMATQFLHAISPSLKKSDGNTVYVTRTTIYQKSSIGPSIVKETVPLTFGDTRNVASVRSYLENDDDRKGNYNLNTNGSTQPQHYIHLVQIQFHYL